MLRRKDSPKQLRPEVMETVWPGDDAVDLEQSDLLEWSRHGAKRGLQLIKGKEPSIIRYRPLSPGALSRVMRFMLQGETSFPAVAFRHGVVSIAGVKLRWDRFGDIRGLDDECLEDLMDPEIAAALPIHVLIGEMRRSQGMDYEVEPEEEAKMLQTSLPVGLGYRILAETFRRERRGP